MSMPGSTITPNTSAKYSHRSGDCGFVMRRLLSLSSSLFSVRITVEAISHRSCPISNAARRTMRTMAKPTSRVLAVLEILQAELRVSGADLARRAGVDRRTIRRYIAHLVEIGVPIDAERGRDGGYALRAGYKLPPMMFSPEEALALAVGLRAAGQIGMA